MKKLTDKFGALGNWQKIYERFEATLLKKFSYN